MMDRGSHRRNTGDQGAHKAFSALLTEFEAHPLARTPLENMDILGAFYVPKDGIEKVFPVIAANAALGWYDALRFGSASGRAEIMHNQGFFKRAIVVSGKQNAQIAIKFLQDNPERTAQLVKEGLAIAERFKDTPSYDRHWPEVYGLERTICALGGECTGIKELPAEQWEKAWDDAKLMVANYYGASGSH